MKYSMDIDAARWIAENQDLVDYFRANESDRKEMLEKWEVEYNELGQEEIETEKHLNWEYLQDRGVC